MGEKRRITRLSRITYMFFLCRITGCNPAHFGVIRVLSVPSAVVPSENAITICLLQHLHKTITFNKEGNHKNNVWRNGTHTCSSPFRTK